MKERTILLTPDLAKGYLSSLDERQRKLNLAYATSLARDIKTGRWNDDFSTVDLPLIISKTGKLLNGQHRCKAVILADTPIHVRVIYGADEALFNYMDNAKTRSTNQFVKSRYGNTITAVAAVANSIENGITLSTACLRPCVGKSSNSYRVSASRIELLDYINSNMSRLEFCAEQGTRIYRAFGQKGGGKSMIVSALWVLLYTAATDENGIQVFVDDVVDVQPKSKAIAQGKAQAMKKIIAAQSERLTINKLYWLSLILLMFDKSVAGKTLGNKAESVLEKYNNLIKEKREGVIRGAL